ncbi:MAG: HyaD/HybD family hydrogenase maturation endopeptidase [Acidobacteria bacterium]|nr:HyaD/HybD family hydrogenase maturation endopeptidase [Acidobacteriota bacterium]
MSREPLLVLGLGNILCSDDGAGALVVHALDRAFERPAGVDVMDGGTLGLSLLPYLEAAPAAILVDAVRADAPPGSIVRLEGADVAPAVEQRLSPHQIGVADLLDGVRWLDRYPPRLVLLGVVPATIDLGVGCSPAVHAALPRLLDAVVEEIRRLGFDLTRRETDDAAAILAGVDLAGVLGLRGAGSRSAGALPRDPGASRAAAIR